MRLLPNQMRHPAGHLTAILDHDCRFGRTWRPVCLDDACGYRGPFVSFARAEAITLEHRRKSAGVWRPAK